MSLEGPETPEEFFETGKRFYLPSSGVADPLLALFYFQKAAEGGHVPAQRVLGGCYLEGSLTAPDYDKALYWLTKAAKSNDGQAAYSLARMYMNGQGVEPNWQVAYKLLNMKCAANLSESRRLKESMKEHLSVRFGELIKKLEEVERRRRSTYTQYRKRFIQPWGTPGRPQFEEEEFFTWLSLGAGQISAEEGLAKLTDLMNRYYEQEENLHPPNGK